MWLILFFGCAQDPQDAADAPVAVAAVVGATPEVAPDLGLSPPATGVPYPDRIDALARSRADLAARYRRADAKGRAVIRTEARRAALDGITDALIPAWFGTPWDFNGMSEEPGHGLIACGYFVSTVLRDAGFRVERIRLAQQAAENIVKTLVLPSEVMRFRGGDVGVVVDAVQADGEGLYVVGLDHHVGFMWNDGSVVRMCHANYLGEAVVVCEDARASLAMGSSYHVVGKLLSDEMIDRWLTGEAFPTVKR